MIQSNPLPLHFKPRVLLPGQPGVILHKPYSGHRGALTSTQSNAHPLPLGPWNSLQGLPRATQHMLHSEPQESADRATQRKLVFSARAHRTELQVHWQRDWGCHPATGDGAAQWITCKRALGPVNHGFRAPQRIACKRALSPVTHQRNCACTMCFHHA